MARARGLAPWHIDEAVRLAPAVLRRPTAVTITELKPVPVWE